MNGIEAAEQRITALFAEDLQLQVPTRDTDLFDTGLVDSLRFVELVLKLEQEFGVEIPVETVELEHFRTVESIAQLVMSRQGVRTPRSR